MSVPAPKTSLVRDWTGLEWSKRAYWGAVYREQGWRPIWDAAQALLAHVRAVQPGFPAERERDADLADHEQLKARLDQVAHAFTGR